MVVRTGCACWSPPELALFEMLEVLPFTQIVSIVSVFLIVIIASAEISIGLPFGVDLLSMCVGLFKGLREDRAALRLAEKRVSTV